jgi:hypothetical protein
MLLLDTPGAFVVKGLKTLILKIEDRVNVRIPRLVSLPRSKNVDLTIPSSHRGDPSIEILPNELPALIDP